MPLPLCVTILAAGKGTRMRNGLAKVLHPLAGRPLVGHVVTTAAELSPEQVVIVLAAGMDRVAAVATAAAPAAEIVIQEPQLGTGHALAAARHVLPGRGTVLVLFGDTPLLTAATLQRLLEAREAEQATVAVLGMRPAEPSGYGRLRFENGSLVEIVEERHAAPALLEAGLCNAGVMAFAAERLGELLDALPLRTERNEHYLTDAVAAAAARGWRSTALEAAAEEGLGVNSQDQLAEAGAILQARLRARAMAAGAILEAPETVQLAADTELGPGALVEPYVVFGPGARVGPGARIRSFSHLEQAEVAAGAEIGPFARLRPGSSIGEGAKVGNFVETKNSRLEPGAKVNHLSYLGDAVIGERANIGAGTITCNYDGFHKHRTRIGPGAFIGSQTALVAPVTVGAGSFVGAGSVITIDVPADALAIARARQENRPHRAGWLRERLRRRKES